MNEAHILQSTFKIVEKNHASFSCYNFVCIKNRSLWIVHLFIWYMNETFVFVLVLMFSVAIQSNEQNALVKNFVELWICDDDFLVMLVVVLVVGDDIDVVLFRRPIAIHTFSYSIFIVITMIEIEYHHPISLFCIWNSMSILCNI